MNLEKRDLHTIAPLVKDKYCWDAFVYIMDHEIKNLCALLNFPKEPTELIRINAKIELLNNLKKYKEYTDGLYARQQPNT